ncbi:MAG: hypothetical protein ACOZIN_00535 [Myxococcota bacterium]
MFFIIIYTLPAVAVTLLSGMLLAGMWLLFPRAFLEQGLPVSVGLSLLLASAPIELAGWRSRVFFTPTYLKPHQRDALGALDAELQRYDATLVPVTVDPGTFERALLALDEIAVRAADGTLNPNVPAWQALLVERAPLVGGANTV